MMAFPFGVDYKPDMPRPNGSSAETWMQSVQPRWTHCSQHLQGIGHEFRSNQRHEADDQTRSGARCGERCGTVARTPSPAYRTDALIRALARTCHAER